MPSEESIPTEASTVHRAREPASHGGASAAGRVTGNDGSGLGLPLAVDEADEIAQAKTVIRGSSRIERGGDRSEPRDRTPAVVAQVLLGQRLNHFRLDELIGGGGMGAVFRAHDEHLDRTVAIKVIPFAGDDPDLRRRFRNEAQSAAKLDHPRIARVFDAGSHGEWHYIVFEYIEGTNIRDLVASNGVMSIDEAVYYTSQLAGALQHAADRGIVHRDIKPSNVLIGAEGKIKLVDMGLARSESFELSEDMTASGVTLGTFDYISPEQAQDPRDADLRSDIYSLGCTLYFMLTGSPPYPGGTMLQKLLSHGNAPPPDARQLRPEVSANLVAVIAKMLAKNPADRYQTATDLIADLREVAFRDGLTRSQSLGPVTLAQPNPLVIWLEKHSPWIAAAALLVASAGWLHLESAASRELVQVPDSARRPVVGSTRRIAVQSAADRGLATSSPTPEAASPPSLAAEPAEGAAAVYPPPESPPSLGSVRIPSELGESPTVPFDAAVAGMGNNAGPIASRPSLDGQDARSNQTRENFVPNVVRLVDPGVASQEGFSSDDAAIATSLWQAMELANQYDAQRIEIAVPIVRSKPVRIGVDNLLITSTVGGSLILFEPEDSVAMERSKMLSIGSHPIEFDDIHFVWNVPSGEIDGGTLFEVNDNQLVRLTDCSITVANPSLRDEVYAFEVITDPDKLAGFAPRELDDFPLVWLELNNVVIRGQMTMLHMDFATKLSLSWDNGLLAVSERMIDTAGSRQPPPAAEQISLSFTRVTLHAPQGILRMRAGVSGAYPVPISRHAGKSLFLVNAAVPHFDISGLTSMDEPSPMLRLTGTSNAYAVDPTLADPMLRLSASSGAVQTTRMNDLLTAPPVWASETKPRWSVNWAPRSRPEVAASRRTPADYRQSDASPPGCDEKSLPNVPEPTSGENGLSSFGAAVSAGDSGRES
jgi:serine/threonine-protein kinase